MLAMHARNVLGSLVKTEKLPKQNFHVSYDALKKDAETIIHFNGVGK